MILVFYWVLGLLLLVRQSSNLTITKHILLEGKKSVNGLEVSDNLGIMNWYDAKIACQKLGAEWRLPTKDELNMLYENKEEIGGFANFNYWSSTETGNGSAWVHNFCSGIEGNNDKNYLYGSVRAVRAS